MSYSFHSSKYILLLALLGTINAHSWIDYPYPRDWRFRTSGNEIDNANVGGGCPYTREFGEATYQQFPMTRVHPGDTLTVRHVGRGHENDPRRGWGRVSLSCGVNGTQDSQEDFDCNVLGNNINHDQLSGYCVTIPPDTPLGMCTVQWWWDFEGANLDFTSCADILVVDSVESTSSQPSCSQISDPVSNARGNVSPLLEMPECSASEEEDDPNGEGEDDEGGPLDCELELEIGLGNPTFGSIVVEEIEHETSCDFSMAPSHPDDACHVQVKLSLTNIELGEIMVNSVMYSNDCQNTDTGTDDDTDTGTDTGTDDGGETDDTETEYSCANPPPGYCCTNNQCPGSYCKSYKAPHPNGFWVCQ